MKRFAVMTLVLALTVPMMAQEPPELLKVKAENVRLKAALLQQQQQQLVEQRRLLQAEADAVVEQLRKALGAKPDQPFNWQTLTFDPPPEKDKQ